MNARRAKERSREEREALQLAVDAEERRERRIRKLLLAALLAAAVVLAAAYLQQGAPSERRTPPAAAGQNVRLHALPQSGFSLGNQDAPLVMTEWVDLQCPFCGRFARDVLPDLIERHVATGLLRIDMRVLAFVGDDSLILARAVAAASLQDRVWPFAHEIFAADQPENSGFVTREFLVASAARVPGLDSRRLLRDMRSPQTRRIVEKHDAESLRRGITGTPAFTFAKPGVPAETFKPRDLTAAEFNRKINDLLSLATPLD